jgi:PGF-CTERM protein
MGLAELLFGICRNGSRLEMYDVNFGGIERMTKRLTIALVALALFVLVAVMPVSADLLNGYYRVAPNICQGATVFIGEQGLDISQSLNAANLQGDDTAITTIGWWASAAEIRTTAPTVSVDLIGRQSSFTVTQAEFDGYEGQWYLVDPILQYAKAGAGSVFNVKAPKLDLSIRDPAQNNGADVSGKSITQGSKLQFQIGTNLYSAINDPSKRTPVTGVFGTGTGSDGYLDILVKPDSGTTLQKLNVSFYDTTTGAYLDEGWANLVGLNLDTQPYTWGRENNGRGPNTTWAWNTSAVSGTTGERLYPAGTYIVSVQSKLNNMKDNYLSGSAAYTGRTISETKTITLVSDTVSITVNKDSVVRTKPFAVTITGRPSTPYTVWIKNTVDMSLDEYDNAPPVFSKYQEKVVDGAAAAYNYQYQNGGGKIVGSTAYNGSVENKESWSYATVTTSTSGTRVVEISTSHNTKAQKYTIRVERNDGISYTRGIFKGDEVDVKVEKGAVTIVAAGDQSYYLGEEIKFSGTNTESSTTYLFIIGPNLPGDGGRLNEPTDAVTPGPDEGAGPWNSEKADVLADNTWTYKWGTSTIDLDAGTYTIYAVSQPYDKKAKWLAKAAYGTVSIIIKKPFVSATASQSTVAKGDRVYLTGTAEGNPSGVAVWILGKNFAMRAVENVNSDATFKYEIKQEVTKDLYSGQYFVVVQHPMQNDQFDITTEAGNGNDIWVKNVILGSTANNNGNIVIFKLQGSSSLQGSDAAEALVQGINDPNVDDTYTKLQFLVEEPIITVDAIGDRHVGDKFTITAKTNLAVDDEVLVQVYSSSFKPTQKSQSGEFSGATGTIKVTKGDSGMNKLSFDVDSSTFKPDEYIVTEDAVIQSATGTALFNVLEGTVPTATLTTVVTTATPIPTPTTVATTMPTPTPTKSPGYGALIALIGLGAVAFIVVRRH